MLSKTEILELVGQYLELFPFEATRIEPFTSFVNTFEGYDLIDRKNFVGHLTASAFIINPQKDALLLLKHKALNRWLQPGGHIDRTDKSMLNAALREAQEETGIETSDLHPVFNTVFDIDSHAIPDNMKKHEPAHVHHDARFLFLCKQQASVSINTLESTAAKWVEISSLREDADFHNVVQKIIELPF